ncbi:MAG: phosphoribosylanthranilate isomerase [Gammaproteobacteria bacterium]|nr:phosphoribosylanthranilate isomerase [Gammaproteobacteria bacterium]
MRLFIKICGITTADALTAAIDAGADAVGFVFAESPRRVTPAAAATLAERVPPGVLRVAVMRHPAQQDWQAVLAAFEPDWLQTDAADYTSLALPASVARLPVYRDTPALDTAAVAREDRVLFEAAASGVGQAPDWNRARNLACGTKLMLAGGLTPANVSAAVAAVRPWGVDVSSGVESGRGQKDPKLISAFVAAARRAQQD